jgi:hypothetical protein
LFYLVKFHRISQWISTTATMARRMEEIIQNISQAPISDP